MPELQGRGWASAKLTGRPLVWVREPAVVLTLRPVDAALVMHLPSALVAVMVPCVRAMAAAVLFLPRHHPLCRGIQCCVPAAAAAAAAAAAGPALEEGVERDGLLLSSNTMYGERCKKQVADPCPMMDTLPHAAEVLHSMLLTSRAGIVD